MSKTKQIKLLLEACEKHEFDKVVKAYLEEEYGFDKIVFTDGKDDTGLDIKVFNVNGKNLQFQLTTQKSKTNKEKLSFEAKLYEDLEKAKINNKEYGYSNTLFFFYSKEVTNKQMRDYVQKALLEYDINLQFIDSNQLAQDAENIVEIQNLLFKLNELDTYHISKSAFDNEKENLIYDLLSFGKPAEFKVQIVEAFILQSFFLSDTLTKNDLISLCENKFESRENEVFYEKLIHQLQSSKRISKTPDKLAFELTQSEKNRLAKKNDQYNVDEKLFINEITNVLRKFSQEHLCDKYIIELKALYVKNFNSDLEDLVYDTDTTRLNAVIREFTKFIETNLTDVNESKTLAIELLKLCNRSKFIQKVAASKVYCGKINYNKLQRYLTSNKKIFIDTSIALYALCYFYNPSNTFNSYYYRLSKSLVEFAKQENIKLFICERYIWEIQNQIKEAFNIVPFTEIPNFYMLGNSRNVFYNFYMHLHTNEQLTENKSFRAFLADFGYLEFSSQRSFNSKIVSHLSEVGIEMISLEKTYPIEEANILFEQELDKNNKFKTTFSRHNDAIMVEFLADKDVEIHPQNPVFVTWDKTFYDVQREYISRFPDSQNWLMLSPNKLIDAYAILKFSITAETVSENLLALISDDLIHNTHSLVDIFAYVLTPKDSVGLEFTNKIASIRYEEINKINNLEAMPPETLESETVIDDVFYHLTNRYQNGKDFELFKKIFVTQEFLTSVISTITKTVDDFYINKSINNEIYDIFDDLIIKLKVPTQTDSKTEH